MKELIVPVALSLFAWLADAQNAPNATAQSPVSSTSSAVVLPKLELRGSPETMFAELVMEAGLSGGVAVSNRECSHPSKKAVSIPAGGNFENAVAQVAKFGRRSEWNVEDGVANFFPSGVVPPLLQVQIPSFTWDKATPVKEVLGRINHLPEVTESASKLGLTEAPFEGAATTICLRGDCGEKVQPEAVLETEENVPLLVLLNRVVRAHKGAVWNYSEFHCGKDILYSFSVPAD
jgi:hypothetical protein